MITASIIDSAVWDYIGVIIQDSHQIQEAMELVKQKKVRELDKESLERSIVKTRDEQAQLMEDMNGMRGNVRKLVLDRINQLQIDLEHLENEMKLVSDEVKKWKGVQEDIDEFVQWCLYARDTHLNATYEEKRRALRHLGICVYVYKSEKKGRWVYSRAEGKLRYEITVSLLNIKKSRTQTNEG